MQPTLPATRSCPIEYCLAPLRLRLHWWLLGLIWRFGREAAALGAEQPDQLNPYWRA
jgi:hypothetical protein